VSARWAAQLAPAGVHFLSRPAACHCGRRWLPRLRLALAGGAGPPSGGTEEARRGGSGTKEGRRRDKEGEAARVWEKEPPVYIPSC
jgi:hypothetical protein